MKKWLKEIIIKDNNEFLEDVKRISKLTLEEFEIQKDRLIEEQTKKYRRECVNSVMSIILNIALYLLLKNNFMLFLLIFSVSVFLCCGLLGYKNLCIKIDILEWKIVEKKKDNDKYEDLIK